MLDIYYKQTQYGTSVPMENVQTKRIVGSSDVEPHIVWVQLKDGWIRIDLDTKTWSEGDYEG